MFTHPFHDIEVEEAPGDPSSRLVKVLAQDGHRFTYLVLGELDGDAIAFVRRMIDGGVRSDLVIEPGPEGAFRAGESRRPLPRHG